MVTNEIIQKMEKAFTSREAEFKPEEIHEFETRNFAGQRTGTGYYVDRGEIEFSRGQIESYVYIQFDDGEYIAEMPESPKELELWTKYMG